jgi:hypothetical protein
MNSGDLVWCPAQVLLVEGDCEIPKIKGPVSFLLYNKCLQYSFYTRNPKIAFVLGREGENLVKIIHSGRTWYAEEKNLYPL